MDRGKIADGLGLSRRHLNQAKALCFEVGIEGKCALDPPLSHDEKADVIDQADPALPGSFEAPHGVLVKGAIDPDDVEAGGALRQLETGGCSQAMLQERHGFEKNIVVRQEDFFLREDRIEDLNGLSMPRISPIGEGVEGRCVYEGQRRVFGR